MINIERNYSLKPHNTLHLDVKAKLFAKVQTANDLTKLFNEISLSSQRCFVLGQGANTLFSKNYNGLIIKVMLKGKKVVREDRDSILLEVGGGEDWSQLVEELVGHNWGGVENLALIPGTVGAAPIQNIAAYGQSFADVFDSLQAVDLDSGRIVTMGKDDCRFGYRDSAFKHALKDKFIVAKVRLKLSKKAELDTSYYSRFESIRDELPRFAQAPYSLADVYKAVVRIRTRKLPNIQKVGSAGSFFKNPVVTKRKLRQLQKTVPKVQFYPVDQLTYPKPDDPAFDYQNHVKVAAGWLLEEIGWKGKRIGNCGTWSNHALIVVTYDDATPSELLEFVERMKIDFHEHYGIWLENEVSVV